MRLVAAEGLTARLGREAVVGASFELGPGMHALLGAKHDGALAALAALAGATSPRRGRALVLGFAAGDSRARAAIAYVPREPSWPDALRVDDALAVARTLRGAGGLDARGRDADARGRDGDRDGQAARRGAARDVLSPVGLGALASRLGRTLAPEELRAVALAEAVTSDAVRAIFVEEPRVLVDARASVAIGEALGAKARAGACVVIATASARDAGELCEGVVLFARAAVVRHTPAAELAPSGSAEVRVVASDARALAARLAAMEAVTTLSLRGDTLLVGAADIRTAADAVAHAAVAAGIDISELVPAGGSP